MEQVASYLRLFLLALIPLLLLKLSKRNSNGGRHQKLPPGPSRLPFIGSLHHFLFSRTPLAHRAMSDLAHHHSAPLMYLQLGEVRLAVASTPRAARDVMERGGAAFAARPWIPSMRPALERGAVGIVFAPHGALWRQLRRISVLELLSARRVRSFRRVREDEARRLAADIASTGGGGGGVNVGERLFALTADVTLRAVVGGRFERREELLREIQEGGRLIAGFSIGDLFPSSRLLGLFSGTKGKAIEEIHRKTFELMDCAIRQHEERRRAAVEEEEEYEDILGVLLRIHKEGGLEVPLTMDIIKSLIIDLFSGGSDTSATTLEWAMSELMRNPRAMEKAQAEVRSKLQGKPTVTEDDLHDLKYLNLVIKETLRLHPALPLLLPRECTEDCKVMGYDVPKGTMVLVNAWVIGRDPEYWDDADAFKPERFEDGKIDYKGKDFELIPFGAGRRMCPGTMFAQAIMELVLATLLYHFDWKLPDGMEPSELDMTEKMGMTVRRKNDLYLLPVVRVPVPPQIAP